MNQLRDFRVSKQLLFNRINLGLIGRVSSCHSSHSGLSPYAGWIPTHKPSDTLEFYDRKKWQTRDAARKAVACWIEIVYNRRRRHSSIGMISPVDFEARIADQDDKKKAAA
ncbi:IS3 family transposase [Corynebacterium propinquum]|uniref:IS3 family transposase n=1 Tax=Corynebacterium propinquum TaxID=43769 RepID=UPI0036F1FA81